MSVFKDKTPIMCTKGATRDLYSNLMVHKRAIANKANKKSEESILRERFKPISKKIKDITNAKKPHQKVDEYSELGSRNSTLSDELTAQTDGAEVEKMPTRASDHDDENGKNEMNSVLPPLYIDI